MKRGKFLKSLLGIAAAPLIPEVVKAVAPVPAPAAPVLGKIVTADSGLFRLGSLVHIDGKHAKIIAVNTLGAGSFAEATCRPISRMDDIGGGPGGSKTVMVPINN